MFFHRNSSTERLENYLYDRDRKRILLMVSAMGERTARALEEAVEALVTLDGPRAAAVVAQDGAIDALEGEIEQECLLSLAMRQPVREDLRFVFSVLKIVTDLERLGDEAANISEKTMALLGAPLFQPLVDIPQMGNLVAAMLRVHKAMMIAHLKDAGRDQHTAIGCGRIGGSRRLRDSRWLLRVGGFPQRTAPESR